MQSRLPLRFGVENSTSIITIFEGTNIRSNAGYSGGYSFADTFHSITDGVFTGILILIGII